MARTSIGVGAVLAACVPACILTTSLDGLTGGAAPQNSGDAAVSDSSTASDAGSGDAPPMNDAGADAARPFRCSDYPMAKLCADFESDPLTLGWDETITGGGGTLQLVPARTSRGFRASIPASSNPADRPEAALKRAVVMPLRTNFTYSFDVLLPSTVGAGLIDYGGFVFHGAYYQAYLRSSGGPTKTTFYLQEYADPMGAVPELSRGAELVAGPAPNVWAHIEMKVTFGTNESHATVKIDGNVVVDNAPIEAWRYASTPHFLAGITASQDTTKPFSVVVDDVLLTTP